MEEELSELDEDSLSGHFDLKGKQLNVEEKKRNTATTSDLGYVVRNVDDAIHRINHYPVDRVVCFVNTYPLTSDLSFG